MLAYAVIACQSESVVHVAYGVWVCLWEPRPYRGFQSVAMCLVLAMFGVRMCPSYLLISFCSRTWSFFSFLVRSTQQFGSNQTFPMVSWWLFLLVPQWLTWNRWNLSFSEEISPFFLSFSEVLTRVPFLMDMWEPKTFVTRCENLCYIYIYLLNFLFVFISSFYFEVFQNFVLDVLKLGKDWNHQNLIGLGCPGAVQSSLGLRQLDLRAGRIDG